MPNAIWNIPPTKMPKSRLTSMTLPRYEAYILEQRHASRRSTGLLPIWRHVLLTLKIFGRGWWLFLIVGFLVVFGSRSILHILEGLLSAATGSNLADFITFIPSDNLLPNVEYIIPSFESDPGALWLILGLFFSLIVVQLWGVAAIVAIVNALPTGEVGGEIERVTSRLISYIFLSLINLLTVIGGLFLLVLPGIVMMIWYIFTPFVHLVEGESVTGSFVKSRQLTLGYGFRILIRIILAVIIIIASSALFSFWPTALTYLPVILLPLNVIFLFLLYENLRLLKRDLEPEEAVQIVEAVSPSLTNLNR